VSIDIDGNLWVEKTKLGEVSLATLKEMEDQIQGMWKAPKNPEGVGRIYLKADDKAEYIKVYPVLEYMNKTMAIQSVDLAIAKDEEE
jgi:biopolymer transport protein ExbD